MCSGVQQSVATCRPCNLRTHTPTPYFHRFSEAAHPSKPHFSKKSSALLIVPARLAGLTELANRSVYCVPGCARM